MVRPIAGKPFVVSRGFRLFRELFKFQDVEKLRDDRIYLAAVTGEIQGDAYTGQIGNVVVDFLECLVWFFTSGIAPLHFCAESGGILGARGHDRPDFAGRAGVSLPRAVRLRRRMSISSCMYR